MVSFASLRSAARRHVMPMFSAQQRHVQRRNLALGGHHGPPPEWTGVDKVVRGYFPEDYQLAIAILSFYGGVAILFKIKSALTRKPAVVEAKPVVTTEVVTTGVPSIESAAFEKFLETAAFEKLLESEDQLSKLVESA